MILGVWTDDEITICFPGLQTFFPHSQEEIDCLGIGVEPLFFGQEDIAGYPFMLFLWIKVISIILPGSTSAIQQANLTGHNLRQNCLGNNHTRINFTLSQQFAIRRVWVDDYIKLIAAHAEVNTFGLGQHNTPNHCGREGAWHTNLLALKIVDRLDVIRTPHPDWHSPQIVDAEDDKIIITFGH